MTTVTPAPRDVPTDASTAANPGSPRRWPQVVFWIAFLAFATITIVHNGKKSLARDGAALLDTALDLKVSDYGGFYRCALRMERGELMYFPHDEEVRIEMPSKHGPFFELMLRPLLWVGPNWSPIVFDILSFLLLAFTLRLAHGVVQNAVRTKVSPWWTRLAFLLLIPYVSLVGRYGQSAFLLLFLFVLALRVLPWRPFLGGALLCLPAVIKLLPLVLLPWLIWRRAWWAVAGFLFCFALTTGSVLLDQGVDMGIRQLKSYADMIAADRSFGAYHERFQGVPSLVLATITPKYETTLKSTVQKIDWDGIRNFLPSEFLFENGRLLVILCCFVLVLGCAWACRGAWPPTPRRLLGEAGLVLLAMLLISPHTWKHYYWWAFPAMLYLVVEARDGRRWAIAALVIAFLSQTFPHRSLLPGTLWKTVHVFHGLAFGLLVIWAMMAWRLSRPDPIPDAGRALEPDG